MRTPYVRMNERNSETEPEVVKCVTPEKYERCTFCNTRLIFSHDLNLSYFEVIETSQCPGCGVATHPRKFTLH